MATIYFYENDTKAFVGSVTGGYEALVLNVPDGCDFTLAKPPDLFKPYRWNGKEWEAVDADNQSS